MCGIITDKITDKESLYIVMKDEKEKRKDVLVRRIAETSIRENGEHPSIKSVDGSTLGQKNHWLNDEDFNENFIYFKKDDGKYWVKWRKYATKEEIELSEVVVNYDNPDKQKARESAFDGIDNINNPIVLTFGAEKGLCVKHILKQNPTAQIFNIEKSKVVYNKYLKNNLPTYNYLGDCNVFLEIIQNLPFNKIDLNHKRYIFDCYMKSILKRKYKNYDPNFEWRDVEFWKTHNYWKEIITVYDEYFDYIFFDSMGYFSRSMAISLSKINNNRSEIPMTKNLIITLKTGKIRNKGEYADKIRRITKDMDDPSIYAINEILTNYTFDDFLCYPSSSGRFEMTILKFKSLGIENYTKEMASKGSKIDRNKINEIRKNKLTYEQIMNIIKNKKSMKKRTSKEVEKCLINVMNKINDGEITNTNNVLTEFHLGMRYGTAMLKLKLIEKIGNKYSYTNNKPISMETAKLIRKTANEIEYENKETRFSETKPKLPKSPTIEEDVKNDIKNIDNKINKIDILTIYGSICSKYNINNNNPAVVDFCDLILKKIE